jgi:nitroreductase
VRFVFLERAKRSGRRLGTYGFVTGAGSFIACAAPRAGRLEDAGYLFERLILHATTLGLGTCWLAGTFYRHRFGEQAGLAETEFIPAVSPMGFPARTRSLKEHLIRAGVHAHDRKPWRELFFDAAPGMPLTAQNAGRYADALEAVRRAPSASNKQPWRIVRDGSAFRFLLNRTPGYGSALGFDVQRLDMGIAMSHFEIAALAAGLGGHWEIEPAGGGEAGLVPIAAWVSG